MCGPLQRRALFPSFPLHGKPASAITMAIPTQQDDSFALTWREDVE